MYGGEFVTITCHKIQHENTQYNDQNDLIESVSSKKLYTKKNVEDIKFNVSLVFTTLVLTEQNVNDLLLLGPNNCQKVTNSLLHFKMHCY